MVQRDDDDALGHKGEVGNDPLDRVGGDETAAFAGSDLFGAQPLAGTFDAREKLTCGDGLEFLAADFAENFAIRRCLQATKNTLKKIRHGTYLEAASAVVSAVSCCSARPRRVLLRGGRYSSQERTPRCRGNSGY